MDIAKSKNGVLNRLTDERWLHITEEHSEMAGYYYNILEVVEEPEAIYEGKTGECIALKQVEEGKYIVAIYRELGKEDGFIITAFLTKRRSDIEKRRKQWPR